MDFVDEKDRLERFAEANTIGLEIKKIDTLIDAAKEQLSGLRKLRDEHIVRLLQVTTGERQTVLDFSEDESDAEPA